MEIDEQDTMPAPKKAAPNPDEPEQLSQKELEELRACPVLFQSPLQIRPIVLSNTNLISIVLINEFEKPYARVIVEKSVLKELRNDLNSILEEPAEAPTEQK